MSKKPNDSGEAVLCRCTDRAVVVTFRDRQIYDVSTVEDVEAQIRALLAKKPENLVVNFAGVDCMVTRVINVLLVALKRIRTGGGEVYLTGMNPNIKRVFDIMRLDVVFKIFDTEDGALAALENQK